MKAQYRHWQQEFAGDMVLMQVGAFVEQLQWPPKRIAKLRAATEAKLTGGLRRMRPTRRGAVQGFPLAQLKRRVAGLVAAGRAVSYVPDPVPTWVRVVDGPSPGLARRVVGGGTDVVVQAQGLERRPRQVCQDQRLAPFTDEAHDGALGQFGGWHLVGAPCEPPGLMDNAFSERNLYAAGGVAGAERAGAAEIWVIKAVDASRPVRFCGWMPAQPHKRRDFYPGRPEQILEGTGLRQPQ